MFPSTADAVIIGGGVMGASSAYHLAKRGMKNIILLERDRFFGTGSTGKCAGGIRHQFSTVVNIQLSIHSIRMLENFEAEMGQALDLKQFGYLILLSTAEQVETFKKSIALQNEHGVASRLLSVDEIAARVPSLNLDGIIAASFYERDGTADPSGVVQGYIKGAREAGVKLFNPVTVTGILSDEQKILGVETDHGTIHSPIVINAAGAWAGKIGEMAKVPLPITPERQQIVVTNPLPEVPDDFPFVIDFQQRLYFHQEGEGLLTGQSMVGREASFDETVDKDWTVEHLGNAIERLPLLEKASVMTQWAGLYENTPDAHPIIGKAGKDGFFVVAGFSGHGFMHGPIAGVLVAEQVIDGEAKTIDISRLAYERFSGESLREVNVI
jgi:sarcosine oxidase, subunit beta